ncbi:MAG TPA: chemotaxis protein CheA, partial [Turneriella sp.]|nr:chemotaxis protein CheA [Turneriella sp.]
DQARRELDQYFAGKLRDLALGIRMVPIGQTLKKYPAAVRDMARKQHKEIRVIIEGEETELDKAILEEISDPLLHMIRNSVDHGIEMPDVRVKNGKSREGTLLIRAEHEGDRVSIFVEDDGGGLNTQKILAKALEKGIVSAKTAENLSEREIFQLIFAAGFSTADKVSELSGRGVGMDVVKNNILRLNGTVDVESAQGVGTRITLKLPLTLSILEGLLLEDAAQMYAIPLIAIEKAYQVDPRALKRVGRYWLIEKNGVTLPVFRIAELFHSDTTLEGSFYLIEAAAAGGKFGLMVQKIVGRQEIVLKPLGDYLGKVTGISGTTILGNGHVALILDTKTIADSVTNILRQDANAGKSAEGAA